MRHLQPEELVDIAEGVRTPSADAHLESCEVCRHQLQALQSALAVASESVVPEPSPLYWDHFSRRVREAVDREGAPTGGGWFAWRWSGVTLALACGTFAVLTLAVVVTLQVSERRQRDAAMARAANIVASEPSDTDSIADDPSLSLVADLTDGMDVETAQDAGLASEGSADHAVTHMSAVELRELASLLKEALAKPGA